MAGTYSYTFNTVLAAHLRTVLQATPREQSYEQNAFLMMLERDHKIKVDRGGYIHGNVSAIETAKGGPYDGATPVNTSGSEDVHTWQYRRALYAEPIQILHSEEVDAGGTDALFSLATHKMNQARKRLENKLSADTWSTSQVTNGLTGVPLHITTTPTTGTLGGLARATYTWWRNKATTSFGSFGSNLNKLDQMSLDVTASGADNWDYLVTDSATFLRFKTQARTYLNINAGAPTSDGGKRVAEFGFSVVEYEGRPVIWDRSAISQRIYFMNNDGFKLGVITGEEFVLTEFQPTIVSGVQGRLAFLRWGGQTLSTEPRLLGVCDGVTA